MQQSAAGMGDGDERWHGVALNDELDLCLATSVAKLKFIVVSLPSIKMHLWTRCVLAVACVVSGLATSSFSQEPLRDAQSKSSSSTRIAR